MQRRSLRQSKESGGLLSFKSKIAFSPADGNALHLKLRPVNGS